MNKSILILILVLGMLAIGLIFLIPLFGPKQKESTPIKPIIQASFTPSPYNPLNPSPTNINLKLISVNPAEDINQSYFPIKQIFFTFNKPMDPSTFNIESSPIVKIVTSLKADDPNTVVVSPQERWQEGITTITIKDVATSSDGSKLNQSIVYKINAQFPKNPPPDAPGL